MCARRVEQDEKWSHQWAAAWALSLGVAGDRVAVVDARRISEHPDGQGANLVSLDWLPLLDSEEEFVTRADWWWAGIMVFAMGAAIWLMR